MKSDIFQKELDYIQTPEIKELARVGLENLPDYFYKMPASTTGKYHPAYALGDGGLVRHTKAAALFMNYICQLEQTQNDFSPEERDCMIAGILIHDGHKEGNNGSKYTVHEHPQICADWVRTNPIFDKFSAAHREIVASVVESHMGQWNENKRSSVVLKKPTTPMQKLVHLCDYLASRKDIEIKFDNSEYQPEEQVDINSYKLSFGKYKDQLLVDVAKDHADYLMWMKNNLSLREPLKSFLDELVK